VTDELIREVGAFLASQHPMIEHIDAIIDYFFAHPELARLAIHWLMSDSPIPRAGMELFRNETRQAVAESGHERRRSGDARTPDGERRGAVAAVRADRVRGSGRATRRHRATHARAEALLLLASAAEQAASRRRSARPRPDDHQEEALTTIPFDPFSDAQRDDPYPAYAALRRTAR
jgi:hypothetical protein